MTSHLHTEFGSKTKCASTLTIVSSGQFYTAVCEITRSAYKQLSPEALADSIGQSFGAHGECRTQPIIGVRGRAPSRVQGQSPWLRCKATLRLKTFLQYHNLKSWPIIFVRKSFFLLNKKFHQTLRGLGPHWPHLGTAIDQRQIYHLHD